MEEDNKDLVADADEAPEVSPEVPEVSNDVDDTINREQSGKKNDEPVLKNSYVIHINERVSEVGHDYADAYKATNKKTGDRNSIAIVIRDRYPVRHEMMHTLYSLSPAGLIDTRDWGVVYWPETENYRFVIIIESPESPLIFTDMINEIEPVDQETLIKLVIPPVAYMLRDFADRGLFHGGIRPDNMFFSAKKGVPALLGECVSSLPGMLQPVAYETIERAMADPQGKGAGFAQDDIYALGATVAVLLRGKNPLKELPDDKIIEEKISKGSFSLFAEGLKLSPAMSEFLRGTLIDEAPQRWDIDALVAWVDGKRSTPRQKAISKKANRAFEFNGKRYYRVKAMARDLHDNPSELSTIVENTRLQKWVERSVGDPEKAKAINEAVRRASSGGKNKNFETRLVAHVSMAMDPEAPVRFRNAKILPYGFAGHLHMAIVENKDLSLYFDFLRMKMGWFWHSFAENRTGDVSARLQIFDLCSKLVMRSGLTNGLERCLYEMSRDVPCLSDKVQNFYVSHCRNLILALDQSHSRETGLASIMDPHIACFILQRDRKDQSGYLRLAQDNDRLKKHLAVLTMFHNMQKRLYNEPLPGLCNKFIPVCMSVAERFNSVTRVNQIKKDLEGVASKGYLIKLLKLVDDPIIVRDDDTEFLKAKREYAELTREYKEISTGLNNDEHYGRKAGREIALIVSSVLGGLIIIVMLVAQMNSGQLF